MSMQAALRGDGPPRDRHRAAGRRHGSDLPPERPGAGPWATIVWVWRWAWFLLLRNRLAIAVGSLLWLLFRSGSQPRRITYPCQQVAAANIGAFVAALAPALWLSRGGRARRPVLRAVGVRRQLIVAGLLFTAGFLGIEGYQFANSSTQSALPNVPPPPTEPPPARVGICRQKRAGSAYTAAEIDAMAEKAVTRAGGLDAVMVDKDGDGTISVVVKPNLVTDIPVSSYPENGVTTDPRVVASVIRLVKEAAARVGRPVVVTIAEGTASGWPFGSGYAGRDVTTQAFRKCGYDANYDGHFDYDPTVGFYDLNDAGGINQHDPAKVALVTIPNAVMRTQYWVPQILLKSDVLISVPTLKNHGNADVTMALKNRVGCAPSDIYHATIIAGLEQQMKHALHFANQGFPWNVNRQSGYDYPPETTDENPIVNYTVVDLNLVRPQDFAVVDGLVGITDGPTGLTKASPPMQMIMAGKDSVAVDTVGTLVMGYNPEYVKYLRWAYNRGLGTMNPAVISVAGDHVALLRQSFGTSHPPTGEDLLVETDPPWITGTSLAEGDVLIHGATITGSGIGDGSARGVVRAEVAATPLGPDLVQNGDFETGYVGEGWTRWRAGWGQYESWDFLNTEPGHLGGRCLKLGTAQTVSSFGVYQQVAVEPGETYRLDAYWKGQKLGTANWFEILLLDGPWDPWQADEGQPATIVEANYMFAYDNNTFGLPGAVGTTFGWVWTHEQYAPPKNQVDWNNRRGQRKATGSVMTVVLKAGACCGSTGVAASFDNVSLREVSEEIIVADLANPPDPFDLTWDANRMPIGDTPAEVRLTVYDAALNEASKCRNVTSSTTPPGPYIMLNRQSFAHTFHCGESPADDGFTVVNAGPDTLTYTVGIQYGSPDDPPWLSVEPSGGASTGPPADPITVHYASGGLSPGEHTATIEVAASGAINTPKTIAVTLFIETVAPDFDWDGDVDGADFGHLQACYNTPGVPQNDPQCHGCDLDGDGDCDPGDLPFLKECMKGAHVIPVKTCDD